LTTLCARPAGAGDIDAVNGLFEQTVVLGAPLPSAVADFDAYRELCLGWYLGEGLGDAGVVRDGGDEIIGYALVCTDERTADRWGRRRGRALAARVAWRWASGGLDPFSRRFYAARARDAATLLRRRRLPGADVHAHVNVRSGRRQGSAALALLAHVDERCHAAGAAAWYGEINARSGRRSSALTRLGMEVVDTDVNHTLSTLVGEPVDRLTVVRRLGT
jgi:hypothetical protein